MPNGCSGRSTRFFVFMHILRAPEKGCGESFFSFSGGRCPVPSGAFPPGLTVRLRKGSFPFLRVRRGLFLCRPARQPFQAPFLSEDIADSSFSGGVFVRNGTHGCLLFLHGPICFFVTDRSYSKTLLLSLNQQLNPCSPADETR